MRVGLKQGSPMDFHSRPFFNFPYFGFGYKVIADNFTHMISSYGIISITFLRNKYMRNKILAIIVFLVIVLGVGVVLYQKYGKSAQPPATGQEEAAPVQVQDQADKSTTQKPAATPTSNGAKSSTAAKVPAQGTFSAGEGEAPGPDIVVEEADHDGSKFAPAITNIKAGDYVFFKNKSSVNFWPVSDPVSAYPELNAQKNIAPGGEFKFQFNKSGAWKFTDKLNPSAMGTVIVK